MSPGSPRVLLVSPPWRTPSESSLAIATLRPILRRAGIESDELHGSLLFPRVDSPLLSGSGSYRWQKSFLEYLVVMSRFSIHLFAPCLYPEIAPEEAAAGMLRYYGDALNMEGLLGPAAGSDRLGGRDGALFRTWLEDIERARSCVERCAERARRPEYDVVGFTATFESQLPAALAIARRLKEADPGIRIMLGGSACFGETAGAIVSGFPFVDVVCHTEGEAVIAPLVRALRGELPLGDVPGIVFRSPDGEVCRTPAPPLLVDMDTLPVPEYGELFRQLAGSQWSDVGAELYFETSRGCWWGQKHLCTFCGLNAEGLAYRRKSADRSVDEICRLHGRYPGAAILQATDNVLDMDFFETVLPRLAAHRRGHERPLSLFFETRTNLRKDQLRMLRAAGALTIQAGIESLSDGALQLMRKGATALGQIQFLKWASEAGLSVAYNLIVGNPGDQAAWYHEMAGLVPYIEHLQPPSFVPPMQLQRFSPYHTSPAAYGLRNVRPRSYYREVFPDPAVDVTRLAYIFDYDHDAKPDRGKEACDHGDLSAGVLALLVAVQAWKAAGERGLAFYFREGASAIGAYDRRSGAPLALRIMGQAARVFDDLDRARPVAAVRRKFDLLDPAVLECLLDALEHRRFVYRTPAGRALALLPERTDAAARRLWAAAHER